MRQGVRVDLQAEDPHRRRPRPTGTRVKVLHSFPIEIVPFNETNSSFRICDLCGKQFGHKDKLKRHMLQMHGTKT